MADLLLTLVVPIDIAQSVEDLLLARPDLVRGFTTSPADGHGAGVSLRRADELVSGHAPRLQIQMAGRQADMEALLPVLAAAFPGANLFYWLVPVLAMGRLG